MTYTKTNFKRNKDFTKFKEALLDCGISFTEISEDTLQINENDSSRVYSIYLDIV